MPRAPSSRAAEPAEVRAPERGFWRVARGPDPLSLSRPQPPENLRSPHGGNRFDSPTGEYAVLYFATELEGCFGETLARLRPDPTLAEAIGADWRDGHFMAPGNVAADWRHRRLAVHAALEPPGQLFLDVEALETRRLLERQLAGPMAALGVSEIDVPAIRSGDKRLSRLASLWAWSQVDENGARRYAGIHYLSRISSEWECWAVFESTGLRELQRREIGRGMAQLQAIARRFELIVH